MNPRKNILVTIDSTPFSDEPLTLSLRQPVRLVRGTPLPTGLVTGQEPVHLLAAGGTGGYVYDITEDSNGGLPPGLTFNATTGYITGTPTTVGHYMFSASVQDSSATVALGTFSIEVLGVLSPRDITPLDGEIGVPYTYTFTVIGATGSVTWAQTSGTIPAGLTLSAAGELSGTPTAPDGISYFTLMATDGGSGDTLDVACRLHIYPELSFSPGSGIQLSEIAYVGIPYRSAVIPSGGKPPYKCISGSALPPGLSMGKDGVISGTPTTESITVFAWFLTDAIQKAQDLSTLQLSAIVVMSPQSSIQPQKNSVDVGDPGPSKFNLVEGANITITASNDGETATYEIAASGGGGGGGVESVNGVGPDSSGNVSINLGSVDSVNGVGPDSSGNVELSIVRGPGCVFENGGSTLSGALTSEIQIPYAATITAWTIAGDVAGSASIVVSHSTYAAYDTMTTLFTATCTTSKKAQATGLSYALSAGDILRFSGSGFAAFTRCSIVLEAA